MPQLSATANTKNSNSLGRLVLPETLMFRPYEQSSDVNSFDGLSFFFPGNMDGSLEIYFSPLNLVWPCTEADRNMGWNGMLEGCVQICRDRRPTAVGQNLIKKKRQVATKHLPVIITHLLLRN